MSEVLSVNHRKRPFSVELRFGAYHRLLFPFGLGVWGLFLLF